MMFGNFFVFHYVLSFIMFMNHILSIQTKLEHREYCGRNDFGIHSFIVGGDRAVQGEFPWMVSLQRKYGLYSRYPICGGTIVASYWVLTAAHCVCNRHNKHLTVVAGRVTAYSKGHDGGTVVGFGRTSESGGVVGVLRKVDLPIWYYSECVAFFETYQGVGNEIQECSICAGEPEGGRDSCQGDSGSPLVVRNEEGDHVIIGIVSWGIGCAKPDTLGVYTNVACFNGWIKHLIETKTPKS